MKFSLDLNLQLFVFTRAYKIQQTRLFITYSVRHCDGVNNIFVLRIIKQFEIHSLKKNITNWMNLKPFTPPLGVGRHNRSLR